MPFPNLPVLTKRQKLTAAIWNQLITALQSFSVSNADISWPLIAADNIDMQQLFTIVGLRTLWNVRNVQEFPNPTTRLQDAVDAVEDAGGGVVFIPPDFEVETTGVTGPDLSNIWIVGSGPSSVLKLSSDAAGPLFLTGTGDLSGIGFMNLTLDGSLGAAGSKGISSQGVTRLRIQNVEFIGFKGEAVLLTHTGTTANGTVDAILDNLTFSLGASNHIKADSATGVILTNIISKTATAATGAIYMEPAAADAPIRDIQLSQVRIATPTGKGVNIVGDAAASTDTHSRISLDHVKVVSPTSTGIQVGDTSKVIRSLEISDCQVEGTVGADGFVVNGDGGKVSGCTARTAIIDGIELLADCQDLHITGGTFRDATVNGINASALVADSDCVITNNVVLGSAQPILKPTGAVATGLECAFNPGDVSKTIDTCHTETFTGNNIIGTGETVVSTYVIPANTITKAGDGIRMMAAANNDETNTLTLRVKIDGNNVGIASLGSNQEGVVHSVSYLNAGPKIADNLDTMWHGGDDNDGHSAGFIGGSSGVTVDFTQDVTISVAGSNSAAVNTILRMWHIELFGGDFA